MALRYQNQKYKKPCYQGFRGPKSDFYTIEESCLPIHLEDSDDKANFAPVHVIQSFDPQHEGGAVDTDIASYLLNSVSAVEWSRCVPYLEILILSSNPLIARR